VTEERKEERGPGGRAREIGRLVIPDRETTAFGYLLNYYDRMQRRGTTIHRRRNTSLLSHQLSRVDGVRSCTRGPPPRSCPSLSPWEKRLYCI
ncbi:hypothetical protein ALC60_06995, partial [Trachymyrmex zeteki]